MPENPDKERAWHPGPPNGNQGWKPITLTDFLLYVRKEDSISEQLRSNIQQVAAVFREKYLSIDREKGR